MKSLIITIIVAIDKVLFVTLVTVAQPHKFIKIKLI